MKERKAIILLMNHFIFITCFHLYFLFLLFFFTNVISVLNNKLRFGFLLFPKWLIARLSAWFLQRKNHLCITLSGEETSSLSLCCNLSSSFMSNDNQPEKWMMSASQVTSSLIITRWWQTGLIVATYLPDWHLHSCNQSVRLMSIDQNSIMANTLDNNLLLFSIIRAF